MKDTNLPDKRRSFWIETGNQNSYPALDKDIQVDVAVVGGGIAGILSAYSLAQAGKKVALLEARSLLNGTTGYTTAKLSAQHQLIYSELIERYDEDHAKLFYEANMEGIDYIRQIADEHGIDGRLNEQNALVYTQDEGKKETFSKEAEAYRRLGIPGDLKTDLDLDLDIEYALRMNEQAEFQPVSFLQGVAKVVEEELGGAVYEQSLVEEVNRDDEGTIHLETGSGYTVNCYDAVFATHFPTFEPDDYYRSHTDPEMSYGLAYRTETRLLEGMYISDDTPKKTFRKMKHAGNHYLLVGGQSHIVGDDKSEMERYEEIDRFAKETFGVGDALYRWSSHDYITDDRIPFTGLLHPDYQNIYTATGFCKWGLADAATGSLVLTDLVLGNENRYAQMYDPRRDIPDLSDGGSEASYDEQIEELSLPDEAEALGNGSATVIEKEDERIGVYKDEQGELHYMDLACTHVGCDLQWNDGDKTWDCSCHGSRFDALGRVVEGPALTDLESK